MSPWHVNEETHTHRAVNERCVCVDLTPPSRAADRKQWRLYLCFYLVLMLPSSSRGKSDPVWAKPLEPVKSHAADLFKLYLHLKTTTSFLQKCSVTMRWRMICPAGTVGSGWWETVWVSSQNSCSSAFCSRTFRAKRHEDTNKNNRGFIVVRIKGSLMVTGSAPQLVCCRSSEVRWFWLRLGPQSGYGGREVTHLWPFLRGRGKVFVKTDNHHQDTWKNEDNNDPNISNAMCVYLCVCTCVWVCTRVCVCVRMCVPVCVWSQMYPLRISPRTYMMQITAVMALKKATRASGVMRSRTG